MKKERKEGGKKEGEKKKNLQEIIDKIFLSGKVFPHFPLGVAVLFFLFLPSLLLFPEVLLLLLGQPRCFLNGLSGQR